MKEYESASVLAYKEAQTKDFPKVLASRVFFTFTNKLHFLMLYHVNELNECDHRFASRGYLLANTGGNVSEVSLLSFNIFYDQISKL